MVEFFFFGEELNSRMNTLTMQPSVHTNITAFPKVQIYTEIECEPRGFRKIPLGFYSTDVIPPNDSAG